MEIRIDKSQLEELTKKLERSPEVIAQAKRKAFERAAPKLKQAVDAEIGGRGKVQSWQTVQVGSRGGYAAVRPKKKTWTEATKKKGNRYAVGYVTNAINNGHKFPRPSGRKYYKSRIKINQMKVPGKHFYESAKEKLPQIAQETANEIAKALIDHMEG